MFKKKRGIRLSYYKQGLIYFLCANFYSLPKNYRDLIQHVCDEVGGVDKDALFAVLTKPERNVVSVAMEYFVSEKKLYRLRALFYEAFWKQGM